MANRTTRTPSSEANFLAALARTANVTRSCAAAGLHRVTVYGWRAEDEAFRLAWDAAVELGLNAIEDEVTRRGVEGTSRPVFYKGRIVGHIREYSDTLLLATLKARRPDTWKDKSAVDHTLNFDMASAMEAARKRARGEG